MMQRRHYVAVAGAVSTVVPDDLFARDTKMKVVYALCAMFETDNPNFDRDRFVAACTTPPKDPR